jgi:hypothetical protein
MNDQERAMLPAQMPVISTRQHLSQVMYFPRGVFGEWILYPSLPECLEAIGTGMFIITAAKAQ